MEGSARLLRCVTDQRGEKRSGAIASMGGDDARNSGWRRIVIEEHVTEREAVLEQIESSWSRQRRRPTAAEVDRWLEPGR